MSLKLTERFLISTEGLTQLGSTEGLTKLGSTKGLTQLGSTEGLTQLGSTEGWPTRTQPSSGTRGGGCLPERPGGLGWSRSKVMFTDIINY